MGNKFGVAQGADDRNQDHNAIMYLPGCKWRGNSSTTCAIPSMPNIGTGGLNEILQTFVDSIRKIVATYGDPTQVKCGQCSAVVYP